MESAVAILVDGRPLWANRNVVLLQTLQQNGFAVPSLCFSPLLGGYGNCGLCVVEILDTKGWQLQHSCLLYPKEGLQIRTTSSRIRQVRGQAAQLLFFRGPFPNQTINSVLLDLIEEGNVALPKILDETSKGFPKGCILCGLCVRICQQIGRHRLTFTGRGKDMRIELVLTDAASCGSCQACQRICPTGYITHNA